MLQVNTSSYFFFFFISILKSQLFLFYSEHVSSEKQLRGGVQFVSEIPRNDAGKILRRKLKEKLLQKSKL